MPVVRFEGLSPYITSPRNCASFAVASDSTQVQYNSPLIKFSSEKCPATSSCSSCSSVKRSWEIIIGG